MFQCACAKDPITNYQELETHQNCCDAIQEKYGKLFQVIDALIDEAAMEQNPDEWQSVDALVKLLQTKFTQRLQNPTDPTQVEAVAENCTMNPEVEMAGALVKSDPVLIRCNCGHVITQEQGPAEKSVCKDGDQLLQSPEAA